MYVSASVRVRDTNFLLSFYHELMSTTRKGSLISEGFELFD